MIYLRFIGEKYNLISAAIRFETRSWASHVELIKTNTSEQVIDVLGCRWPKGIQHYPYITKGVTKEVWYTANDLGLVWQWMENHVGAKYDLSAIFGIALDANFHKDNRDICSESLIRANEWAITQPNCVSQLAWLDTTDCWRISPRDILLSPILTFYKEIQCK